MRRAVHLVLIFLVSAALTAGLLDMLGGGGPWRSLSGAISPPAHGDAKKSAARQPSAATRLLPATERLRQAQDEYLKILRDAPTDAAALSGLVAIRRQLAGGNATILRRQAGAYRQLIARGGSGPAGYSRADLERLEAASLRAAAAIEAERRPGAPPVPVVTAQTPARSAADRADRSEVDRTERTVPRGSPEPATRKAAPSVPGAKQPEPSQTRTPPPAAIPAAPPEKPPAAAEPSSPQAPAGSEPTPAPPPAGSQPPASPTAGAQPPAAGQPSPPASTGSEETIAVVSPPPEPSVTQSQGSLVSIDCQKRTFVLHAADGDEEYLAAANITIYVRGARSERVADICALRGFLGRSAMAWSVRDGDRRVARWVSVVLPQPAGGS